MGKALLLIACLWPFAATAAHHSCIAINGRNPDLPAVPALALKVVPADSGNWIASLFDESSQQVLGTYKIKTVVDSATYTILASTTFALSMYERRGSGHRRSELQVPALKINSGHWICKDVP